ncbi:MAG: LysM peptidoglycan-binding domain-containing protein [bacterium]
MNLRQSLLPCAAALGLMVAGCATRQQGPVAQPSPTPVQLLSSFPTPGVTTAVPPFPTPEPTPKRNSYVVKPGDSLWLISGLKNVQGDSFLWPLLFKANRDQIIDPDLIEPNQDLTWNDFYTTDEMADAKQKAGDTPPYVPHSQPRKMLPLKY